MFLSAIKIKRYTTLYYVKIDIIKIEKEKDLKLNILLKWDFDGEETVKERK